MKVYLASPYRRREELLEYSREFEKRGFEITARWLTGEHSVPRDGEREDSGEFFERLAMEDFEDLLAADALVAFPLDREEMRRGGMHVEVGIALGSERIVVIVGPARPNIFYHVSEPFMWRVESVQEAMTLLFALEGVQR